LPIDPDGIVDEKRRRLGRPMDEKMPAHSESK
jgi:hypothetical protein